MKLLEDRQTTHGDFHDTSVLAQVLKYQLRNSPNWGNLSREQAEALDMIATKIARILSGDPCEVDHWLDIAGYAHLGLRSAAAAASEGEGNGAVETPGID